MRFKTVASHTDIPRRTIRPAAKAGVVFIATLWSVSCGATEGGLGRQIAGTNVLPNAGIVAPTPITVVNLTQIYFDGTISAGRDVPIAGQTSLGLDGKISFTLASLLKTWDTGTGRWNFASGITVPYIWTKVEARLSGPRRGVAASDTASNLYDLYVTPITAGYHFSETSHIALSLNVWMPTGRYDEDDLANPSLNTWTFVPQVAYTKIFPESKWQLDMVAGLQLYTRNSATDYRNAPLFSLDVMGRRKFDNGVSVGLIVGTIQQLGSDNGPTADRLSGFKGRDWALGPVLTYDRKLAHDRSLSLGLRWVPTISSKNRLDSNDTVMATAALIF
ncbi:SphA family protein [Bordetella petrii]|uniref:SphA family protein n=1 Tax=Bordetella petrii TaxID=94624 RepID=UPI001A968A92|nr:transporter [Bordetella petrii]MBO1113845.1 transporter [Bordetella petrii]